MDGTWSKDRLHVGEDEPAIQAQEGISYKCSPRERG